MIYLAVFSVCPPRNYKPTWVEGRVGRRGRCWGWGKGRGTVGDREKTGSSPEPRIDEDFVNGSVQSFRRTRIFLPQNTCMCQKKAAVIGWLINELPRTKIEDTVHTNNIYTGAARSCTPRPPPPATHLPSSFCKTR